MTPSDMQIIKSSKKWKNRNTNKNLDSHVNVMKYIEVDEKLL